LLFYKLPFAQNKLSKDLPLINVPDLADPAIKIFYQSHPEQMVKCMRAIREKNEPKAIALFKDPG